VPFAFRAVPVISTHNFASVVLTFTLSGSNSAVAPAVASVVLTFTLSQIPHTEFTSTHPTA